MWITKGQHLRIKHTRKGEFDAVALRDFEVELTEFLPVAVAKGYIPGISVATYWAVGEEIPCQKSLCSFELLNRY